MMQQRQSSDKKTTGKQIWVPKGITSQTCEYRSCLSKQLSTNKEKMCQIWVPKQKNTVAQSHTTSRTQTVPKQVQKKQIWIPKVLIQAQGHSKYLWLPKKAITSPSTIVTLPTDEATQPPSPKATHNIPKRTSQKSQTKQVWRIKDCQSSSHTESSNIGERQFRTIKQRAQDLQVKLFGNVSLLRGILRGSAPASRAEALGPNCSKTSSCTA